MLIKSDYKIFITGKLNNFTYQEAENIINESKNKIVKDINKANIVVVGNNFNDQIIMKVQELAKKHQAPLLVAEDFLNNLWQESKTNKNSTEHDSTVDLKIQKLLNLSHTSLLQALHILNVLKVEIASHKLADEVLT